jgi:hypothetical protein
MQRLAKSNVLVVGAGGVGIEIGKRAFPLLHVLASHERLWATII